MRAHTFSADPATPRPGETLSEIDKSITVLEKRLEALERQLRAQVDAHPLWKKKLVLLIEVKGIGFITALSLLAKMPELGTLNCGQCAALGGLAPYDDDSGKHQGERLIRGGRKEVRCALYIAALGEEDLRSCNPRRATPAPSPCKPAPRPARRSPHPRAS